MTSREEFEDMAEAIREYLERHPDPVRRDDLLADLGITSASDFHKAKGVLQDALGDDEMTIVGTPASPGGWLYSLQANPSEPNAKSYQTAKAKNMLGRLRRAERVAASLSKGVSKATNIGKAAARVHTSIRHAVDEVEQLLAELSGG